MASPTNNLLHPPPISDTPSDAESGVIPLQLEIPTDVVIGAINSRGGGGFVVGCEEEVSETTQDDNNTVLDAIEKHYATHGPAAGAISAASSSRYAEDADSDSDADACWKLQGADAVAVGIQEEDNRSRKADNDMGSDDMGKEIERKFPAVAESSQTARTVTLASVPGAFAMAPSSELGPSDMDADDDDDAIATGMENAGPDTPPSAVDPTTATNARSIIAHMPSTRTMTASASSPLSSTNSTAALVDDVVAIMVEEGTNPELQQAQPMSRRSSRSRHQEDKRMSITQRNGRSFWALLGVAVLIMIVGVVLLVTLLPGLQDSNGDLQDADPQDLQAIASDTPSTSLSPSSAPSSYLEMHVLKALLPPEQDGDDQTQLLLSDLRNASSPQSQALQWLLDDPTGNVLDYPPWRLRQRYALAVLYFATRGDDWNLRGNWLSYDLHECDWWSQSDFAFFVPNMRFPAYKSGNPCDQEGGNATSTSTYKHLWLWDNNLDGTLPEQVYWLSDLRSMSLFRNPQLTGTISTRIGTLRQLEGVTFAQDGMTGTLPTELGLLNQTLWYWSVFANDMHGTLPSALSALRELEMLILDQNQFTGTLPYLGNWNKMSLLYAQNNELSGTLHTEIGLLHSLGRLHLDHNQLTGMIPSEFGELDSLLDLGMPGNSFTGRLPSELGSAAGLQVMEMPNNLFSGVIPSEIGALWNLTHFLLQDNLLTGEIPSEMLDLIVMTEEEADNNEPSTSLKAFNVSGNPLTEDGPGLHESDGSSLPMQYCWTQTSFYQSLDCKKQHPAASCRCNCAC